MVKIISNSSLILISIICLICFTDYVFKDLINYFETRNKAFAERFVIIADLFFNLSCIIFIIYGFINFIKPWFKYL